MADKKAPKQESIDNGMFDFQTVMNEFYNNKPGEDDSEGRAIKNNFQANMVQSAFDASLAKDMAHSQAGIAQQNMITAADLEARNTSMNMEQEFNYGMQSMGAQMEYQDKFANNQHERDLGTLTATGEQARLQQKTQGSEDRLTATVKGEQDKSLAKVQGEYNVMGQQIGANADKYKSEMAADASKYGSKLTADSADKATDASITNTQTQADASKYGADNTAASADKATDASITNTQTQADASITNTKTQADADRYGAKTAADASKYGADRTLDATKDTNKTSTENIRVTGDEGRKTMGYQDDLDAKKSSRQSARSRSMARSF